MATNAPRDAALGPSTSEVTSMSRSAAVPSERTFDVIVVGGGVVGLSVAYCLSERRDVRVAVLERGRIGQAATWAAAGMLAVQCEVDRPGPFLTFALAGRAFYSQLAPRLYDEIGVDIGLRRTGALRVALSEAGSEGLKREMDEQRRWGLRAEWLDELELRKVAPLLAPAARGGVYLPDEGHVDNRSLAMALATACARRGVCFFEHTEVTGWLVRRPVSGESLPETSAAPGTVLGVKTPAQDLYACAVVLAGGAWSEQLAAHLGVRLPVMPVRGEILALRAPGESLRCMVFGEGACYLVPKPGRLLVGATEAHAGFRSVPTLGGLGSLATAATRLAPALGDAEVVDYWSGLRPGTADGLPILGPVPGWAGLYVATGHYRNGILLGPLSGMVIACLIRGEPVPVNWRPFGLAGRFEGLSPTPL